MINKKYLLKSSFRASRLTRVIAKGLDLFIVLILISAFKIFGVILSLFYISISDSMYGGQSIGKKVMGFSVISLEDGKPCTIKQSIIRNLPFLIPLGFGLVPPWGFIICILILIPLLLLELYLLFRLDSAHRLGDVMADTTVIANGPNRIDLRKAQESWFKANEKGIQPVNRSAI